MKKDLFILAQKSIAFNPTLVEELNKKVALIDPRLYLFAYYQPKILPSDTDIRGCFNLAILNMYGLLWDCGKMVMCQLFGNSNSQRPSSIQSLINVNLSFCNAYFSIVSNVRTCLCHNNSDCFYYNREKLQGCHRYFENTAGVLVNFDGYNETQWEAICRDFINRSQRFGTTLDDLLENLIQEVDLQKKSDFIQYWLDCVSKWYESDFELISHVLAERYKLKCLTGHGGAVVTKTAVRRWAASGWQKINGTNQTTDFYEDYIRNCSRRIPGILARQDCPKPALPLDILSKATADASQFVLSRRR